MMVYENRMKRSLNQSIKIVHSNFIQPTLHNQKIPTISFINAFIFNKNPITRNLLENLEMVKKLNKYNAK